MAIYPHTIGIVIPFRCPDLGNIGASFGALTIKQRDPFGKLTTLAGIVITDAATGRCQFTTTAATDLPGDGTYRYQASWVPDATAKLIKTEIGSFEVSKPLEEL